MAGPKFKPILKARDRPLPSKEEQELRSLWSSGREMTRSSPQEMISPGGGLPEIRKPKHLTPNYPETSPSLSKPSSELLKLYPELAGKISKVTMGPDPAIMNRLAYDRDEFGGKFYPEDLRQLSLLGLTATPIKGGASSVGINPRVREEEDMYSLYPVLAHEFTHAAGYGDEKVPERAGELALKRFGRGR